MRRSLSLDSRNGRASGNARIEILKPVGHPAISAITPANLAGPAGRADGRITIGAGAIDPFVMQALEVWRANAGMAFVRGVAWGMLVGNKHEDVGAVGHGLLFFSGKTRGSRLVVSQESGVISSAMTITILGDCSEGMVSDS